MTTEIAWAAGLFEGEGCFTILHQKKTGYRQVRAKLSSTDEDIVRRFHEIIGVGAVREDRAFEKYGYKRQWMWYVGSRKNVQTVIDLLWPWLGERRKARATELLAVINKD